MNSSPSTPIRLWQILGALFLLVGSYIDNLRGPLLPLMAKDLNMTFDQLGQFLALGNLAAIIGTFLLIPIMNRISERRTGMAAMLLVLLSWVVIKLSELGFSKIYLAFFFGLCTSVFGTLSNIFIVKGTPVKDQARTLSVHQMMYGLGSMIAPAAVALSIDYSFSWTILIVGLIPIAFTIILLIKLGLPESGPVREESGRAMKFDFQKISVLLIFMGYVAAEVACSMWMATYLYDKFQLAVNQSAHITGSFFAVMMLTRLFCFFFGSESRQNLFMWISLMVPLFIVTLVQLGAPYQLLPLCGLFGPFFPMYFAKVSKKYTAEWRSMAVWLIVALQLSLMLMHLIVGRIANAVGSTQAYWFIPFVLMFTLLFLKKILRSLESTHSIS